MKRILTRLLRPYATSLALAEAKRADKNRAIWRERAQAAERQLGGHADLLAAQRRVANSYLDTLNDTRTELADVLAELKEARATIARLSQDLNGVEQLKLQVAQAQPHLGPDAAHYISRTREGGV